VEGALIFGLTDRTRLLKQVRFNVGSSNVAAGVKVDSDKFAL